MSKASEWAERRATLKAETEKSEEEQPDFEGCEGQYAWVGYEGGLRFTKLVPAEMTPAEALALARWILDTFGEPASSTSPSTARASVKDFLVVATLCVYGIGFAIAALLLFTATGVALGWLRP